MTYAHNLSKGLFWISHKCIISTYLTAIDWLRQEELQEVPPKNGYFQIDG